MDHTSAGQKFCGRTVCELGAAVPTFRGLTPFEHVSAVYGLRGRTVFERASAVKNLCGRTVSEHASASQNMRGCCSKIVWPHGFWRTPQTKVSVTFTYSETLSIEFVLDLIAFSLILFLSSLLFPYYRYSFVPRGFSFSCGR